MSQSVSVMCLGQEKWRSRRKFNSECPHYDEDAMYCRCAWGYCPNGHTVYPIQQIKEWLRIDKETEEFWKRHKFVDGKVMEL